MKKALSGVKVCVVGHTFVTVAPLVRWQPSPAIGRKKPVSLSASGGKDRRGRTNQRRAHSDMTIYGHRLLLPPLLLLAAKLRTHAESEE